MPRKLWEHPNPESTNMAQFMRDINQKRGTNLKVIRLKDYQGLSEETKHWYRHSKTYFNGPSTNAQTSGPISSHYTL